MAQIILKDVPTFTESQKKMTSSFGHWNDDVIFEIDGNNKRGDVLFWVFRPSQGWRQGRIGKQGKVYYAERTP